MKYSETIIRIKRIVGLHVFVMLTILIQSSSIIAQTKQETINWLNIYGKSYLKELSNSGSEVKSLAVNSYGYVVIELEDWRDTYSERGGLYKKIHL